MSRWIFSHKCIVYKVLYINVSLPDVASGVIPLFNIISVVISFAVIVSEDDEANKVEFVLIDVNGELTETLY